MSLTKVSYSMITGSPVNVLDFGADATGVADSTPAFVAAQIKSKNVYVPPGRYSIDGLRFQTQVSLIGSGKGSTVFVQRSAGTPAINCISDVTTNQLNHLNLKEFSVEGHPSATVAAAIVGANSPYVVYRSNFDFDVYDSFRGLETIAADAQNVYDCSFKMNINNSTSTSVLLTGGVYNTYDFFIVNCLNGRALSHAGFNNTFVRLVTEGQIASSGQNDLFLNPTIEEWSGTALPAEAAFNLSGFAQNLINPTLILNAANSLKVGAAFQPFAQTILNSPNILVDPALTTPCFGTPEKWTLIGPGRSACADKMEVVYTGATSSRDLRNVTFVGNCSAFTLQSVPHGGKNVQYLAPTVSFNFTALNNTDAVIFDFAGVIATANVNIGTAGITLVNNQVLSFYSRGTLTALNLVCPAGANVALLPTTMAAGSSFSAVYFVTTNTWYPIG